MKQQGDPHAPDKPKEHQQEKSRIFPEGKQSALPVLPGGYFQAGVIALHPASGLLAGAALGWLLRQYAGIGWAFPLCLLFGLGIGCLNAYRDIKAMLRRNEAEDAAKKPPYI